MQACFWLPEGASSSVDPAMNSQVNWEEFVHCQMRANETYSEAKGQFSDRNRDVPKNVQSSPVHKRELRVDGSPLLRVWCSTRIRHCLRLLVRVMDWCVSQLIRLHDLLSDHFDSKQSREAVDLPLTCHPSPSLTTFAFRSTEARSLLLELDSYGGSDPFGMFPFFS